MSLALEEVDRATKNRLASGFMLLREIMGKPREIMDP